MYKCLMLISRGLEKAAEENILEIIPQAKMITLNDGAIIFELDKIEQLCELSYMSQIANRILILISEDTFTDYDDMKGKLSCLDKKSLDGIMPLIKDGLSFRTVAKVYDEVFDIPEIEKDVGSKIYSMFEDENKILHVDLKTPDIVFYIHVFDKHYYMGLDISGDLSKRDYRIFNSPMSVKGTTAFGVLKIAGYKQKDVLLDTFCNSGTVCIEAALYSSRLSPRFFNKKFPFMKLSIFDDESLEDFFNKIDGDAGEEKLRITAADTLLKNITAAKKNAKIAGVEKFMEFRRIDTDWLDLKFEERTVDKIITFIPGSSKHKSESALEKSYKEFFYQSEYILKNSGHVIILCLNKDKILEMSKEHFMLDKECSFNSGEQSMTVLIFKKVKR